MELHALAQLELERLLVDPFPRSRELALVFVGIGITIDQGVPHLMRHDHADTYAVKIGIDVIQHLFVGNPERVVLLGRHRRRCEANNDQGHGGQTTHDDGRQTMDHALLLFSVLCPPSSERKRLLIMEFPLACRCVEGVEAGAPR